MTDKRLTEEEEALKILDDLLPPFVDFEISINEEKSNRMGKTIIQVSKETEHGRYAGEIAIRPEELEIEPGLTEMKAREVEDLCRAFLDQYYSEMGEEF